MRSLKKWWPFRAKTQGEGEASRRMLHERSPEAYGRDLSLGGAVMMGLGAKRFLLPTFLVGHPVLLFSITTSTTAVTGYHYVRRFWHGVTSEEKIEGPAITGTVSMATLALRSGVPALTSIWLLNLGGYLKARAMTNMPPAKELEEEQATMVQAESERLGKLFHLASWGVIGAGVGSYVAQHRAQLANMNLLSHVIHYVSTSPYGPLLYMGFYAIQPPFTLAEGLFTVAGGFLFGPVWGLLYAFVGNNAEAMFSYTIGRYFGPRILDKLDAMDLVERYGQPIKENTFETILTMRLLMVPNDVVSCLAGTLQVDWKPFLLATAIGSIPLNTSLVLFGSSITNGSLGAVPSIDRSTLAASGAIFVSSMALSRYLKAQKEGEEFGPHPQPLRCANNGRGEYCRPSPIIRAAEGLGGRAGRHAP